MCNFIKLLNDLKKITMRKKVKGKEKKSWEISKFWLNKLQWERKLSVVTICCKIRCNGLTRLEVGFVDQSNFLTKIISF